MVVTLVVQGFTLAPVVRRSGIALEPEHTEREEAPPAAAWPARDFAAWRSYRSWRPYRTSSSTAFAGA